MLISEAIKAKTAIPSRGGEGVLDSADRGLNTKGERSCDVLSGFG